MDKNHLDSDFSRVGELYVTYVKRARIEKYQIDSINFDYMDMQSKIEAFGRNEYIDISQIRKIQLCAEELTVIWIEICFF